MGQNLLAGKIVYKGDEQIDMDHREDEGEQKKVKGLLIRLEAWATTKNDGTEDFTATKYTAWVEGDTSARQEAVPH